MASARSGRWTLKVLPRPTSLATATRPPCSSTNWRNDAEPERGPLLSYRAALVVDLKFLEHMRQLRGIHARAGVDDPKANLIFHPRE